jgi:hypothetical protein
VSFVEVVELELLLLNTVLQLLQRVGATGVGDARGIDPLFCESEELDKSLK